MFQEKLDKARALLTAHNTSASSKLNIDEIFKRLEALGGTTDEALRACSYEDLQEIGIPKLLARQVATIFRQGGESPKEEGKKKALKPHHVEAMTVAELLEHYDPTESDNLVGQRLTKITKNLPCIVFNKDGSVNVQVSRSLVQEIKDGLEPRETYLLDNVPQKLHRIGERPGSFLDENPLYKGRPLRGSDEVCDQTNRSWQGVSLVVRQVLHLAVYATKEQRISSISDAHDVLDRVMGKSAEEAEKYVRGRYAKASLEWDKLSQLNQLPSLKLVRGGGSSGQRNDPFYGEGRHKTF